MEKKKKRSFQKQLIPVGKKKLNYNLDVFLGLFQGIQEGCSSSAGGGSARDRGEGERVEGADQAPLGTLLEQRRGG